MHAAAHYVSRGFAKLALAWLLASCDPNVMIGSKLLDAGASGGGAAGVTGGGVGTAGASGGGQGNEGGRGGSGAAPGSSGAGEGGEPGLIFLATHEDGTLSDWDEGPDADAGGFYADTDAPSPQYATNPEPVRSGTGSARLTIDTSNGDTIARLYRRVSEHDAYYSAWFYLSEAHTPGRWWSIFLFRAVQDRADSVDLWSVNLVAGGEDQLTLSVYDHAAEESIAVPGRPVIEVGQWFELSAHLVLKPGAPSRVEFFLDGQSVLVLEEATQPPEGESVYWVIGNGGSTMTPAECTIYVDDARISRGGP